MPKAKEILEQVQLIGEAYSREYNKKPDHLDQYKPEVQTELIREHQEKVRAAGLKKFDDQLAKTKVAIDETKNSIRSKKYPLLSSRVSSDLSLGETQNTNAILQFQNHYKNGNADALVNAVNQAREFRRYDFVSTIVDELEQARVENEFQHNVKDKLQPLADDYLKDRGIPPLKEEMEFLEFDSNVIDLSMKAINRHADFFPTPTFKAGDYQTDEMFFAQLKLAAGE